MPPKKVAFPTKKGKAAKGEVDKKKSPKVTKKVKPPKAAKKVKPPKAAKKEKPPKGAKKVKPSKPPIPEQVEVPDASLAPKVGTESKTKLDKAPFTKRDYFVIALLWGYEVVFVIAESTKASFLYNQEDPGARTLTVDVVPKSFSSLVLMVHTVFWMMTVAVKTYGRGRLLALFIGLIIYLAVPIFGLLASMTFVMGFSETVIWLQTGWHAVNPMRFWLIFNQKFPLPAHWSRIVVTTSVFVIGIAKYITSVWLTPATLNYNVYAIMFSIIAVVMITCLFLIFRFRVFFNEIEDDIDLIASRYKYEDVEDCFQARQTQRHILLFSLLLCPSVMFSILESAVVQLIRSWSDDSFFFANYRLDMIIGLISLLIVCGVFTATATIRQEIRDLLIITLALLLNFLVLALLFFQMLSLNPVAPPALHRHVFLRPDSKDRSSTFRLNGVPCACGMITQEECECTGEADKYARLQGFDNNSKQIFSFDIDFKPVITYWFLHHSKLHRIRNKGISPPANESERIVWAVSSLDPCEDGPSRNENGHTYYLHKGKCGTFGVNVSFRDSKDGPDISGPFLLDIPQVTEGVSKSIPYTGGIFLSLTFFLDGLVLRGLERNDYKARNYTHPPKHLEFMFFLESSIQSINIALRQKKLSFLHDWPVERPIAPTTQATTTPPPYTPPKLNVSRALLTAALAIAGVPVGIASASYIHFIWIQSPWYDKTITLAGYFGINYFGSWYVRNYVTGMYIAEFQMVLIVQIICFVWHVLCAIAFNSNLRDLPPNERSQGNLMLF